MSIASSVSANRYGRNDNRGVASDTDLPPFVRACVRTDPAPGRIASRILPLPASFDDRCVMADPTTEHPIRSSGRVVRGRPADEVRILVDNGEYWLTNKGDQAIIHVTVRRLRERLPSARIGVLTNAPMLLAAYEPDAEPVCYHRGGDWIDARTGRRVARVAGPRVVGTAGMLWAGAVDPVRSALRSVRDGVRSRRPGSTNDGNDGGDGSRTGWYADHFEVPRTRRDGGLLPNAVDDATLVIAMGGGYLTDVDEYQAHRTLSLLERALERRVPTALLGQGIGPLDDPTLRAHAARVLPRVDHIALREGRRGPALLRSLGVPDDRVVVTGDDAVELGYRMRADGLGRDLWVCLRIAGYSPVTRGARADVGRVVRSVADRTGVDLVPLPVSEHRSEDRRATMPLVSGHRAEGTPLGRFAGPQRLAAEVSRCRVLVTGAYHVAVFAMAQGIPVVGLTSSRYYDDKLGGLGEIFGTGFVLVRLDEPALTAMLERAITALWDEAERLRQPLRERARAQIDASRASFDRVTALVARYP